MIRKILMKVDEQYYVVKKTKDKLGLIPSKIEIDSERIEKRGSEFVYSSLKESGNAIIHYIDEEDGEVTEMNQPHQNDYDVLGKMNLNNAIEGLEKIIDRKKDVDYATISKNSSSRDWKTHWDFKTKVQLYGKKSKNTHLSNSR